MSKARIYEECEPTQADIDAAMKMLDEQRKSSGG